MTKLDKQGW